MKATLTNTLKKLVKFGMLSLGGSLMFANSPMVFGQEVYDPAPIATTVDNPFPGPDVPVDQPVDQPIDQPIDQPDPTNIDQPFAQDLAPYGEWVEIAGYGRCWRPARVAVDWRPYTVGCWVQTEFGLTWQSDEPWAACTYHYGRWIRARHMGWCWIPGNVWAPAWVSWRSGGDFIGWAPLGPRFSIGMDVSVGGWEPDASYYSFVPTRCFGDRDVYRSIVNVENNTTIINRTTNITNINVVNNRVVNNSLERAGIDSRIARNIPRVNVDRVSNLRGTTNRGTVPLYTPTTLRRPTPTNERLGRVNVPVNTNVRTPVNTNVRTPINTNVRTPVSTNVRTPINTNVRTPVNTNVRTPVTPNVRTPVTPNVRTPVTPTVRTPVTPTVRTPVTPTVRTPVTPTVRTPVTPTVRTPVTTNVRTPVTSVTPVGRTGHTPSVTTDRIGRGNSTDGLPSRH